MEFEHSSLTSQKDRELSRLWTDDFLSSANQLPISFIYDGQQIHGIPESWLPVSRVTRLGSVLVETEYEGNDPQTGLQLRVTCRKYLDSSVVEWTAWFTNKGNQPTPILRDILAMDCSFEGKSPRLYNCNGDFENEKGYTPLETPLEAGHALAFAPNGGRPCDGAFPYYRVIFEGCGLTLAIGWPAQWSSSFLHADGGVQIKAGQQTTNLSLLPGESIRTPTITLLSWNGDQRRSVNLWRRWYRKHIMPFQNGKPLEPKLSLACTEDGEEFTGATEENQKRFINQFHAAGIDGDVWWIDAGWYPCYDENHVKKWVETGTWEPDQERFPAGLKAISDQAAAYGTDLLLWFEPERVRLGTKLAEEHPEWLLHSTEHISKLLNLGDPDCRQWLTDHICKLIQDNGVKIYRQDFNFPPLSFWKSNDAEDRQGISENLHVQGYLRFWDDLLDRNPGLLIDSCASGGRRNDLETMRRSVPFHYTDAAYGTHSVKLAFHHTVYDWIPYFREMSVSWDMGEDPRTETGAYCLHTDNFSFHCAMAAVFSPALDIRRDDYDMDYCRKMIGVWRSVSGILLNGDYYPHTAFSHTSDQWMAWQFDLPEADKGFIQAFRHKDNKDAALTVRLEALRQDVDYLLENPETGESMVVSGASLAQEGLTIELAPRSALIWQYSPHIRISEARSI